MNNESNQKPSKSPDASEKTSRKKKKEPSLYKEDALEVSQMSGRERRKYKAEIRKQRLAQMEPNEKKRYILQYYKWYFIGGIVLIVLAVQLGKTIYHASLPLELMVAVTNTGSNAVAEQYIEDSYRDYYGLDKKNVIQVFTDLTIDDPDNVKVQQSSLTDYEKVIVYISSGKLDAIIGDEAALNYYRSTGDIAMLDQCLDKDLLTAASPRFVEVSDPTKYMNAGKPYVAALDISNTDFAKNCSLSYDKVYLMLPNNRYDENQNSLKLIRMILGL